MTKARSNVPAVRRDGLQLEEHRAFQERFWVVERVAWMGFVVVMAAAMAGLTGNGGPLASRSFDLGGAELEAPRVTRREAPDQLVVRFGADGATRRSLTFDRTFGRGFQIERVLPRPSASEATGQGQRLIFDTPTGGPAEVILYVRATRFGPASFDIRADGGAPRRVPVMVLP